MNTEQQLFYDAYCTYIMHYVSQYSSNTFIEGGVGKHQDQSMFVVLAHYYHSQKKGGYDTSVSCGIGFVWNRIM